MTTDYRALCAELADALQYHREQTRPINRTTEILDRARAAMAQLEPVGPTDEEIDQIYWDESWRAAAEDQSAVNEVGLEEFRLIARAVLARYARPAIEPEPVGPTDEEIMELMPQQMHEDLAAAARALAERAGTDSRSAIGVMRIMLNRHAVDLTRAVLARWGRSAINT